MGALLERTINRIRAFYTGSSLVIAGLFLIVQSASSLNAGPFELGLSVMSFGSGLLGVPGYSYLLDVTASYTRNTTLLIAIFGIATTISRTLTGVVGGLVVEIFGYSVLFIAEIAFVIVMLLPIRSIHNQLFTKSPALSRTPIDIQAAIDL